ncbi:hypothetical protein [Amycolatopsis sp. H20-H5]|uniref:hypothetical protein n=1 Tax=Amycolatopsis sp. H20-H5 TaxID=3046309 RepID=UPI002DB97618|nr:hypothetical protein [Amycolatopsis sp. H20-H5]MEC3974719.1 hypothetical protein [Amycolatopsis sp. H20-H5]
MSTPENVQSSSTAVGYASRKSAAELAKRRVLASDDPIRQAALEQLAVTYSIRTILMWTLVIVPVALVALAVVLSAARP